MMWKSKSIPEWRRKFALLPHKISDSWIWLEWYDASCTRYPTDNWLDSYHEERWPSRL